MSKLKIYTFPDKILAAPAQPIARVEKTLHKVADDMLETMYDAPGIGLAANQVGILDRIIVVDTEYELQEEDLKEGGGEGPTSGQILNKKPTILINPEIIYTEGKTRFNEGCLSVPEYYAEVDRAEKIKVKYKDIDGKEHVLAAEGLQAICLQHEIDHLDGKLFIEHLSALKKEMARKKLLRERKQREDEGLEPPRHGKKGL